MRPRLIVVDLHNTVPLTSFLFSTSNLFDFRSRGSGTVDHSGGMDSVADSPTSRVSFEELLSDRRSNLTGYHSLA
ncbi:unnamed protein product [Anisakis simplex]|uniref:Uncharacterized protein n=1 Tax=Anisakis simplex TaxID=6269 RepID=A0A0M3K0F7_ANISI|nr:unnamed protein product [Anisakis simplex]